MRKVLILLSAMILTSVLAPLLRSQNVFQNPSALEAKVMERALTELPGAVKIYPNHSMTSYLATNDKRGLQFYIGQKEELEVLKFNKIVANIAYTQNPRTEYLKEENKGIIDFNVRANEVVVTIDVNPGGYGMNVPTAVERADQYNIEQQADRQRRAASSTGTNSVFQTKRALPGETWDDYMTKSTYYLYAVARDRDYLGAEGELYVVRDNCITAGYPIEYYNGFVHSIVQEDIPIQIYGKALLVRGNNKVLIELNTTLIRNQGMTDRILHEEQADAMMTTLVRILLEEMGEIVTEEQPPSGNLIYETDKYIPALQANITGFNLFNGGMTGMEYEQRKYIDNFPKSTTTLIWFDLNLTHEALDARRAVMVEAILIDPNNQALDRKVFDYTIEPGWVSSYYTDYLTRFDSRTWETGKYRIELYILGSRIAAREFIVTD